jgi:SAM-dependent methyltransferase
MKSREELAADQAAFWNGPGGQGWLAAYGRIERSVADLGKAAVEAAAAQPGEHVLDIGCGTGGTTAELARAIGANGHVLGVDISEPLIGAARSHRVDNATFVVGDAVRYPFKAGTYDLAFSRFGVMFFADPVAAFKNILHALKPTGRLVFLCWRTPQENPWGLVPLRAAQPFLPPMPRPGPEDPGQYSFGDRARVERILKDAGFGTPSIKPLDRPIWMGNDAAEIAENSGRFGPMARAFAEAEPAAIEKAKAAIAAALAPNQGPNGVILPGACWLVSARLPDREPPARSES